MNDDEVTSNLACLVDNDLRLNVDVDQVIRAGVRRRRNRRGVIGTALGTVGLVTGLLTVTSLVGGGVDPAGRPNWTTVDTDALGLVDTAYDNGISATGPSDVWAIGENHKHGVAMRWDGRSMTRFDLPMVAEPSDIAAVAPNDVWVVGRAPSGSGKSGQVAHWDGRQWKEVPGAPAGDFKSVSAVSANDVWAVGSVAGSPLRPLVLHWDGQAWKTVDVPSGGRTLVMSVAARASDDVWITLNDVIADQRAVYKALHWDGRTWTVTPTRWDAGGKMHEIVSGPNEMWLYGSSAKEGNALQRWDGHRWTDVPLPLLPKTWSSTAITSDGRGGFIMAGSVGGTPSSLAEKPLVWHWDGTRWSDSLAPDGTVHVSAVGTVPGTGTLWLTAKKQEGPLPSKDAPPSSDPAKEPAPSLIVAYRQTG